jgi:hypothetical protein
VPEDKLSKLLVFYLKRVFRSFINHSQGFFVHEKFRFELFVRAKWKRMEENPTRIPSASYTHIIAAALTAIKDSGEL